MQCIGLSWTVITYVVWHNSYSADLPRYLHVCLYAIVCVCKCLFVCVQFNKNYGECWRILDHLKTYIVHQNRSTMSIYRCSGIFEAHTFNHFIHYGWLIFLLKNLLRTKRRLEFENQSFFISFHSTFFGSIIERLVVLLSSVVVNGMI